MNPDTAGAESGEPDVGSPKHDLHWLMAVFVIAAAVRFGAAMQTPVISKDSVSWYITPARQAVQEGRWRGLLEGEHHPLYPALLAAAGYVIGEWDVAGQALGVLLGSLLVFPCYSFAKTIFGARTGLFAALVVALMPRFAEYSGDVLSEPLVNLLMMWAVAFGAKWAKDYRWRDSALCGAFSGLSYLARPEGLCAGFGAVGWAVLIVVLASGARLWGRRGVDVALRRAVTVLGAVVLCFAFAFPYLYHIRQSTGAWRWTKTHYIRGIILVEREMPLGGLNLGMDAKEIRHSARREFEWRTWVMLRRFGEANYPFIFLLFVGLWQIRKRAFHLLPAWYVSLHFWGLFLLLMLFNYISPYALPRRHYINLGALAMPWIGLGMQALWECVQPPVAAAACRRWLRTLSAVLLMVGLGLAFHFAWIPHRLDKIGLRRAGEWIFQAHGGPGARVLALSEPRPAFYARGVSLNVSWEYQGTWDKQREFADLRAEIERLKPDYLVIETDVVERAVPDFMDGRRRHGLAPIKHFIKSGEGDTDAQVWVFRFGDRSPGARGEKGRG